MNNFNFKSLTNSFLFSIASNLCNSFQKDFFFIFKATTCYTVTFDHFIGIIFERLSYCSLSQKCWEKSKKLFSELFIDGL